MRGRCEARRAYRAGAAFAHCAHTIPDPPSGADAPTSMPCFAAASPVRAEGLRARTRGFAHPAVLTNSPRHGPRPSPRHSRW